MSDQSDMIIIEWGCYIKRILLRFWYLSLRNEIIERIL